MSSRPSCCFDVGFGLLKLLEPRRNVTRERPVQALEAAFRARAVIENIDPDTKIEYITDVEGNWDYFLHFVSLSKVLHWEGEEQGAWGPGTLALRDGGMLVFGGGAVDKGPGDIRFTKTLLSLKVRYPDRVFIVLGNRDINKLRFSSELAAGEERDPWQPYWPGQKVGYHEYLEKSKLKQSSINVLRWMYDCNMGCETTAFRNRKHELALLYGSVTDEDVLHSCRECVDPAGSDPWMLDLLRVGKIGVVLGDVLFVHGGVCTEALGAVPGCDNDMLSRYRNAREWVAALNDWKDGQLLDFLARPRWTWERGVKRRGGEELIDYGVPNGCNGISVIYYNPFEDGNLVQRTPNVEDYLQRSGIRRVCSGHQPHGQTATIVRHVRTGLLVVTGDTSYSDMGALKLSNPANNRGIATSVVRFHGAWLHIEGVMRDGTPHECKLNSNPAKDTMPDALVGRQLQDGSWVRTTLDSRAHLYAAMGKGYQITASELTPQLARKMLRPEYNVRHGKRHGSFSGLELRRTSTDLTVVDSFSPCSPFSGTRSPRCSVFNQFEFEAAKVYIISIDFIDDLRAMRDSDRLYVGTISKINKLMASGKSVIFITENSNESRRAHGRKLVEHGIKLDPVSVQRSVVSTSYSCAWNLRHAHIKRPFVLCSETGILDELRDLGITGYVATTTDYGRPKAEYLQPADSESLNRIVSRNGAIDAVVISWDRQLTLMKVEVAAAYLKQNRLHGNGAIPLMACSDSTSGVRGTINPGSNESNPFHNFEVPAVGSGAMAQLISNCSKPGGHGVTNVGKSSVLFLDVLQAPECHGGYGINFADAIVIGNKPHTDIALARLGGMKSLLITNDGSYEVRVDDDNKPTWVLPSLMHACDRVGDTWAEP